MSRYYTQNSSKRRRQKLLKDTIIHDSLVIISTHADLMRAEGHSERQIGEAILREFQAPEWLSDAASSFSDWGSKKWQDAKDGGLWGGIKADVFDALKRDFVAFMLRVIPESMIPAGLLRNTMAQVLKEMSWDEFLDIYKNWDNGGCETFSDLIFRSFVNSAIIIPGYDASIAALKSATKGLTFFQPGDLVTRVSAERVIKIISNTEEYEEFRATTATYMCSLEIPSISEMVKSVLAGVLPGGEGEPEVQAQGQQVALSAQTEFMNDLESSVKSEDETDLIKILQSYGG